jgi:L-lactate dehydrogenase (cytochrome)
MDMNITHPAIADLRTRARRRIPHFAWEYLDSATGHEHAKARNRTALDAVLFAPAILQGLVDTDLRTTFLGQTYDAPFGIAPVGMSGLIWTDAERILAATAAKARIPYGLSTVATQTPEAVGPKTGGMGWFQMYPPSDADQRRDMLARAKGAGFHTLVLTVDVPVASRRERQRRGGITQPPKITPRLLAHILTCPAWAFGTAQRGMPRMRTLEKYVDTRIKRPSTEHIGYLIRAAPDWDYLHALRAEWDGKLIVKGVLRAADAPELVQAGVDAIWVSNHAGRQFDGAPAALDALRAVREATGDTFPLIFDSGIEGGLDVLRALALGADMVMLGRAFHFGLGAFGADGAAHVVRILKEDMIANMGQMAIKRPSEAKGCLL